MARQVNSPSELFQSGPSESQIFEGLDELIPSSVLYSLVASTPIVPEPLPEPQPQVPFQRRAPRSKRYSHVQIKALETFIAVHPTPTYEQKFLLSQHIGLTMKKINKWILKHKAPVIQSDEQLIAEAHKQKRRVAEGDRGAENAKPNPHQRSTSRRSSLEVSSDDSIDQELLWGDIRDFMPTSTEHSLMLVPSEDLPGPAHDLVGVPAEEVSSIQRLSSRNSQLRRVLANVSTRYSCTPSSNLKPRGTLQPSAQGPITIVQTLMEVDQWLHIFCSMVTNAQILEVLSPGEEESYKERKQVMSAELVLTTPYVPAREAQFVRYSHQQLDGSWIVVDVSVDELRQFHRPSTRSVCRKRPSGCLIRDMQNGSSLVTWVENVDVREKEDEMHAILKPFVESSFAFGASRWIVTLQRQAERFIYSTGINISPSDAPISLEGRRSLTMTANKMVISFCTDICNSTYHHWTSSNKTRQKNYGGQDQQAKG
ncbi:hypothetical protein M0R45_006703 [Rubus argutus]|uniref:START domain-containing protein n=1 Tax=Rubus argutus TaxID=59490 RepID=A0AAW1YR93_RUBAR